MIIVHIYGAGLSVFPKLETFPLKGLEKTDIIGCDYKKREGFL